MLPNEVLRAIQDIEKDHEMTAGAPGQMTNMKDLTFSRRVVLYHEDDFSIVQQAQIIQAFKANNSDVQLMGPDYLLDRLNALARDKKPPT